MKLLTSLDLIQKDLKEGSITCSQLVQLYLENIEATKHLNAYLEVYELEAKARAVVIDEKIKRGAAGKLAGMVVSLKDVLAHKEHSLQASSKILDGFQSQFNATAVQRLLDEDAIIIGRTNCDEFGMGSSNENSAFGDTLNGLDTSRVPGGSSGGSAVAVQTDTCLVSLGSDTGGSVRQPAAFCGVLGFKPTYSRISRYGLIAYASSFDCIGIFARHVEDIAITLEVVAGSDEFDSTVSRKPVSEYSKQLSKQDHYKIAYLNDALTSDGLADDIKQHTEGLLHKLEEEGHSVEGVDFPMAEYVLPAYYILSTAEASSNLSRYDGVRYGFRATGVKNLEEMYKRTRTVGFGTEVKRRIMLGTFVLSASYYDAYYTKAQKVRKIIRDKTKAILKEYDFIVSPTTPTTAFTLGKHQDNPLEMYLTDLFTVQASVSGLPAISVPNGNGYNGLPVGIQVIGDDFEEEKLLAFSKYLMDIRSL